jgi:hypothetical protein
MQDRPNHISIGKHDTFSILPIPFRPVVAGVLSPKGPSMGARGESWSIGHWRALGSDPTLDQRISDPPSEARAAEITENGKQNAYRCGASGGNPGRRGKG